MHSTCYSNKHLVLVLCSYRFSVSYMFAVPLYVIIWKIDTMLLFICQAYLIACVWNCYRYVSGRGTTEVLVYVTTNDTTVSQGQCTVILPFTVSCYSYLQNILSHADIKGI